MVLTSKVSQLPQRCESCSIQPHPPGPIGTQLRLVDAKWAVAVEVALGSVLASFVVDNHTDGAVLKVRSSCIKSLPHLPYHN